MSPPKLKSVLNYLKYKGIFTSFLQILVFENKIDKQKDSSKMFLPPILFTIFLVFSVGRCQFVYNYEEAETNGSSDDSRDETLYQYNSPSATNEQFQSTRVQSRTSQGEVQSPRRNTVRTSTSAPPIVTAPPSEYIEESESPRNSGGPRKRKYKRILREGTYEAPPSAPRVYSPSIFENIELGQAPSGVYVPQDSFLNVLKNPSYRQSSPSQYTPQGAPTYYQPPISPAMYFVNPPSNNEARAQEIHPSVQYIDGPSNEVSTEDTNATTERPNRRRSQTARQGRQRQQNQRVEPHVDIDALRNRPDTFSGTTPYVHQARQVSQPTVSVNRQRPTIAIQSFQTSRAYSPSVFQNIALGEAPNGVHIPSDSLLNVLRSSPSRLPSRNDYENSQYSSNVNAEQNYFQPDTSVQPTSPPPESRRRSRQRARTSNTSNRGMQRRTQYQSDDEELQPITAAPVSSQQQHRQQNRRRNSESNRRYDSNIAGQKKTILPKQEVREGSRQSQSSSSNRQSNYKPAKLAVAALPEDTDDDGIPGEAGVNYPTLHTIPQTSFACAEQQHNGYYADLETSCQVFHLCQARGVKSSFLCSNGTIFSQEKFSCQWWYKVNCEDSPKFYSINDSLYKVPEKKKTSRE
ncbi:hypothetical protein JTE90_021495 [Oedothorax gibbosus]|uniref:Chitin-binding type-2 domain-containing protein n=1 Tax=Oedothorax gibbosus TaxID=931172 RepID=A0AAV6VPV1_9ARAC|nr:hypothetical protein JTE90_021495 [Oedothorax gibbosus]